ncbi:hypothetical protein N181_10225 [Sinorhizobium fredii USDA 205]|uniref:hypothetical protein n=1 Tax=Rhizobium fredii TaxID=380 RepID=UPI00056634D2|nr:hypothetical protein [Sinorhizobium fredii]KSV90983.1 hypothetical protein N181_10225 [Sinorhizobium fredii USDA 205]UTY49595.1 hypothetical protein EPK84_23950 [Sinorhizobium fredii]GEC30433.1 hypothetical protein EFR01_06040 [Sinorhizobium fredii]GLS09630.1 hypothetical protein GCM10007864_32610 [Sinorhizobium fredii]
MKSHLRLFAVLVPLTLLARYTLFEDAGEFQRFYGALRIYLLPVVFVMLAVLTVLLGAALTNKIDPESRERVINLCFWGSSTVLAAAVAYAFAVVKLTAAP